MSDDPEETVHEYHAKSMAAEVRQLFRSAYAGDSDSVGNCLFCLGDCLTKVLSRYLTLPRAEDGIWKWNATAWHIDRLQLQRCSCQTSNDLHLIGTLDCSLRYSSDAFSLPPGVDHWDQSARDSISTDRSRIRWIEPFDFQIALHPGSGEFSSCHFRLGDKRPFEEKRLPIESEIPGLREHTSLEVEHDGEWLAEVLQSASNPAESRPEELPWLPSSGLIDTGNWLESYLKVSGWYVQLEKHRQSKLGVIEWEVEGRDWLRTMDDQLVAYARQYVRMLHDQHDRAVRELSLLRLDSFLETILPILLAIQDSKWDGSPRWIDGTGLELVTLDPGCVRFQSGRTYVMLKQSRWYYQPCEFEMEFCPSTGAFKKYVLRFGDYRPLKACRESADPNNPVGGWAYQFERFALSTSTDE
jgi:hypothetical protein